MFTVWEWDEPREDFGDEWFWWVFDKYYDIPCEIKFPEYERGVWIAEHAEEYATFLGASGA
jgi:hypothetical protein